MEWKKLPVIKNEDETFRWNSKIRLCRLYAQSSLETIHNRFKTKDFLCSQEKSSKNAWRCGLCFAVIRFE